MMRQRRYFSEVAYTGHVYDESTGLYYAKARYYSAKDGRYISEDSYRGEPNNPTTLNLYIYSLNNPVKYVDPSGHMYYLSQTDDLVKGLVKGAGSFVRDILQSPYALYCMIKQLVCEELSIKRLIQMGLNALVEDLRYVINHLYVLKPCKKNSNQEVVDMGYHTGRLICEVVLTIKAGKAIATKFKNSKLGGKLIEKFKRSGNKGTNYTKSNQKVLGSKSGTTTKPNQVHHFATNKSKKYTSQFESIAKKYGLDLDGDWNKELMPHQGRHPYAYHDYVLDNMQKFDRIANGDKTKFLKLYDQMKQKIINLNYS